MSMEAIKTTRFEDIYIIKATISRDLSINLRGLMGNTYKVINRLNQLAYAAKKIPKTKIKGFNRKQLQSVGEIITKMEHPNIASVFEIYDDTEFVYMVMEYVKGVDLIEWMIKLNTRNETKVCGVVKTLLDAVQFVHSRGIVHRHIQPSSILVSQKEGITIFKFTSFHHALFLTNPTDSVYTCPESVLTPGSDLWSIGVLLHVMLTGNDPKIHKQNPQVTSKEEGFPWQDWKYISCSSKHLVQHLLKLDPTQRFKADDIKNHPWIQSVGNVQTEYPQLKYNLIRQNFNLRTKKAISVTNSYLQ